MAIKLDTIEKVKVAPDFTRAVKIIIGRASEYNMHAPDLSPAQLDRMITRLKRLRFQEFKAAQYRDTLYLHALTRDMIYEIRQHTYNVGPYHIFVPEKAFYATQLTDIHMIPSRYLMSPHRFLHHYANLSSDAKNPLDGSPHTCWGNIGPSLLNALIDYDIADVFRVLYIYLDRLNFQSPLDHRWEYEATSIYGERIS